MSDADARRLEQCLRAGGVAVLPTDTVYGLACDPLQAAAVQRLHALKGRPAQQPAAVMFFDRGAALAALPELVGAELDAVTSLLPGPVTLLLRNRARRYPLAGAGDPDTLGLRVPRLDGALATLAQVASPLLQSSANPSGGADARRLDDVDPRLLRVADLVLDGGDLPGIASTVVDLRGLAAGEAWRVVREGALPARELQRALGATPWRASHRRW